MKNFLLIYAILVVVFESCAAPRKTEIVVCIETNYGDITVKLYDDTPLHRDNFMNLVDSCFYDGILFHRVIADFMIQSGDPNTRVDTKIPTSKLGAGYTIPSEFVYPKYYHKKGALAAARLGDETNPQKASSASQFYIVQGKIFTNSELDELELSKKSALEERLFTQFLKMKHETVSRLKVQRNQVGLDALRDSIVMQVNDSMFKNVGYKFTAEQRRDYTTVGGAPHLDGDYTVFGEVISGLDVVTKISNLKCDEKDQPLNRVKIIKVKRMN